MLNRYLHFQSNVIRRVLCPDPLYRHGCDSFCYILLNLFVLHQNLSKSYVYFQFVSDASCELNLSVYKALFLTMFCVT